MTDKTKLDANNSANLSDKSFSDERNGDNAKDMDKAQLIELGKAAFNKFCDEYEIQGLVSESEQDGFETGYVYAIQSQSAALAKSEARVKELDLAANEALCLLFTHAASGSNILQRHGELRDIIANQALKGGAS